MTHLQDGQTELSEQPFICLDFGFWSSGSAVSELVILVKLGAAYIVRFVNLLRQVNLGNHKSFVIV